jgi:uncharacterized membrane protein
MIPAFVDFAGNPIYYIPKSYISIMRLPLMGILLTAVCYIMYLEKLPDEAKKISKLIWPVAALICSLKTGITSLDILFNQGQAVIRFRAFVIILVLAGIAVLVYGLMKLMKNKLSLIDKNEFSKGKIYLIGGIVCVYVVIVLMTRFLR